MRALLAVVVLMFSLSGWAQSNPPTPSATNGSGGQGQSKHKVEAKQEQQTQQTPAAPVGKNVVATDSNTSQPHGGEIKSSECGAVVVAIFALIVACGALFVAYRQMGMFETQLGHMKAALDHSGVMAAAAEKSASAGLKQTTYLQQSVRAYVLPDNDAVITRIDKMVGVTVNIKNFGQTPAKQVMIALRLHPFGLPLSEELTLPDFRDGSKSPIGPGGKVPSHAVMPEPLTDQQLEGILHRKGGIFVWGQIKYFDVFDVEQTTNFKFLSTGDDFTRSELMVCEDGNDAT